MESCVGNISTDINNEGEPKHKAALVERELKPRGVSLVNPNRVSKMTYLDLIKLEEDLNLADTFIRANAMNKLDVIGREMKHLQSVLNDVINETKLNNELNNVACNFVKKPGHTYHLYEKPSEQQYFSMLSPEEWENPPHKFLGSFKLEVDQSWTPAGQEETRYEGFNFLKNILSSSSEIKSILNSNS